MKFVSPESLLCVLLRDIQLIFFIGVQSNDTFIKSSRGASMGQTFLPPHKCLLVAVVANF